MDRIFINTSNITAPCPHCGALFSDSDERILKACNANKCWWTRRTCADCGKLVGLTFNYMGDLVAFPLTVKGYSEMSRKMKIH